MTHDEIIARCRRTPDMGELKHEDFADYITVIERRKRTDQGWVNEGAPYMSVDGRLAMANDDHRREHKRLIFEAPVVMVNDDEQLTLMVAADSEIYGRRHGIATSRKVDGSAIEMQHPWEIAETSAIGRALAAMGYGLLPGSGLASADDMLRSGDAAPGRARQRSEPAPRQERQAAKPAAEPAPKQAATQQQAPPEAPRLSERQQAYLVNAYMRVHAVGEATAANVLNLLCLERYGRRLADCTPHEGRELSLDLRDQSVGTRDTPPAAAAPTAAAQAQAPAPAPSDTTSETRPQPASATPPAAAAPSNGAEPGWAEDIRGKFRAAGWTVNFREAFIAVHKAKGATATEVMIAFNGLKKRAKDDMPGLVSDWVDRAKALGVEPAAPVAPF
jgi:hypothetical protein